MILRRNKRTPNTVQVSETHEDSTVPADRLARMIEHRLRTTLTSPDKYDYTWFIDIEKDEFGTEVTEIVVQAKEKQ